MSKEIQSKLETLYIEPEAMRRIEYYTDAAKGEVSGLGTIIIDKDKDLIVDKVYLLEQEASQTDTELDPGAISALMGKMIAEEEDPSKLKFWWHSHVNMGVFWSGTDDACAETLSREYAFSLVVNKKGERKCRLDLYHPFRLTIDNLNIVELAEENEDLKEECKLEVAEKVKSSTIVTRYNGYNNYQDHDDYYRRGFGHFRGNQWDPKDNEPTEPLGLGLEYQDEDDIDKLVTISDQNMGEGSIFADITWREYIVEILKDVVEESLRFEGDCNSAGTYEDDSALCKECDAKKKCEHWTNYLKELTSEYEEIVEETEIEEIIDVSGGE